jgi:hypothetical protein
MFILTIISDIILSSSIFLIVFIPYKLREQVNSSKDEVIYNGEDAISVDNTLSYSWAVPTTNTLNKVKVSQKSNEDTSVNNINSHYQYLYEEILDLINTVKSQGKYNILFFNFSIIFLYADLFIAKIFLVTSFSTAYIMISLFMKIFVFVLYFTLKDKILYYLVLNKFKNIEVIFHLIIYSLYMFIFYIFFNFSKFIIQNVSVNMFTEFHTALPYIFIANVLYFSVIKFLHNQKQNLVDRNQTLSIAFNFAMIINILFITIISMSYISTLEAVAFFISGMALLTITLLYHLFYRLHIYIQLV